MTNPAALKLRFDQTTTTELGEHTHRVAFFDDVLRDKDQKTLAQPCMFRNARADGTFEPASVFFGGTNQLFRSLINRNADRFLVPALARAVECRVSI